MMPIFLFLAAAIAGYLIAGFNPAITLSRVIYHRDIRECGSGNPGFTNFKRTFGHRWAWVVLVLDLTKAALVVGVFAWLFHIFGGDYALGAAYTGAFAMLGHVYPVYYHFCGGKGFLVCLSTMWVLDPRVGVIATLLMVGLLFLTKYMSVSTVLAMWSCPVMLAVFQASPVVLALCVASVLLMTWRHRANFRRLLQGTESKFRMFST